MIRYLFFTLLGFFGPALLMLLARLLWFQFRQWLARPKEPEVIDITPQTSNRPGTLFYVIWILLSIACTALLIWQLDDSPAENHTYIPAHIDAQGHLVPAQTLPADKNTE